MATGVNPIQLALRDLGQGFGNILSDEAKRRQDALLAQQQQGQLSLAQAQLRNQAEVAAAQGQVSLAEVGAQGRYRDQQHAIEQERTQITRDTLTETRLARQENYGLAERKLNQVDIPSAQSTIGYHNKLGDAAVTTATANAERDRAYIRTLDAQKAIVDQQHQAGGAMVNLSQLNRELDASDPERGRRGKAWMAFMTPYGESDLHRTDKATGDVHAAMAIVGPRLEAYKGMEAMLGKPVSDTDIRAKAADTYGKMSDMDKMGLPYETYERRFMAMQKNPSLVLQGTQQVDTATMPALRQHEIAVLTKELRRAPTAEEIKARIDPLMNRRRNEELDELSYRAMGVAPPTAAAGAPPPGTKGLPPLSAKPSASGAASTAWGGYPGPGALAVTVLHQAVVDGAIKRGLDPAIALAQFQRESGFNPAAVGKYGEIGLSQFTTSTANDRKLDLNRLRSDAMYNLNAGLDYMADLKKRHGGRWVEAYNGLGAGAGDKNYVQNVQNWVPQAQQTVAALQKTTAGRPPPSSAQEGTPRATDGPTPRRTVSPALSIPPVQPTPVLPGAEGPGAMRAVSRASGVATPPPSLAAATQPSPDNTSVFPNAIRASTLSPGFQETIFSAVVNQLMGQNPPPDGVYQVQLHGGNIAAQIQGGQLIAVIPTS